MQHTTPITGTPVNGYIATGLIIPSLGEPEYHCPCCGDYGLARSDMADDRVYLDKFLSAFIELYGAGICDGCAGNHVETNDGIRLRDHAVECKERDCWITEDQAFHEDEARGCV